MRTRRPARPVGRAGGRRLWPPGPWWSPRRATTAPPDPACRWRSGPPDGRRRGAPRPLTRRCWPGSPTSPATDLPALGGEGPAYRLAGAVDEARVRALADAARGRRATSPTRMASGRSSTGDAVLEVYEGGGGSGGTPAPRRPTAAASRSAPAAPAARRGSDAATPRAHRAPRRLRRRPDAADVPSGHARASIRVPRRTAARSIGVHEATTARRRMPVPLPADRRRRRPTCPSEDEATRRSPSTCWPPPAWTSTAPSSRVDGPLRRLVHHGRAAGRRCPLGAARHVAVGSEGQGRQRVRLPRRPRAPRRLPAARHPRRHRSRQQPDARRRAPPRRAGRGRLDRCGERQRR